MGSCRGLIWDSGPLRTPSFLSSLHKAITPRLDSPKSCALGSRICGLLEMGVSLALKPGSDPVWVYTKSKRLTRLNALEWGLPCQGVRGAEDESVCSFADSAA